MIVEPHKLYISYGIFIILIFKVCWEIPCGRGGGWGGGGRIGCCINRIASNFFFCSYDARISFNNLLPVLCFLLIVLFCILLQKCSLIWITFCAKLCLGRFRCALSSLFYLFILIYYLRWCSSFVLLSEDIKNYPGPTSSSGQCFSICHWNLNSITAHNFAKLSLLTSYNLVHNFDIICLLEKYLNSETPPKDTILELLGYNLFCSDHPSNNKRGGFVFITNRPFL